MTDENAAIAITLTAADPDSDPLTFLIETEPGHGILSGTPPNLTYTPDTQYDGTDSFQFKVNDGEDDSALATVSITISNVNILPIATDQCLSTREETPLAITLQADDADHQLLPLTYEVVTDPEHGILSGTPPDLIYTPDPGFQGHDSFAFWAYDGLDHSNIAPVEVNIDTWFPVMWWMRWELPLTAIP